MSRVFPFAAALATTVWISVEPLSAEPPAVPSVRPRHKVHSIPPFSPDGPSSPITPPSNPTATAPAATIPPGAVPPAPVLPAAASPALIPGHPMPPPTGPPLAEGLLAWDGDAKESTVMFGAAQTSFVFSVSNVSPKPITITSVHSSCGCTLAKLPTLPWTLAPGATGTIDVVMTLAGKRGLNIKSLIVNTDCGHKTLIVRTNILEQPAQTMSQEQRAKNLLIATANRQAVLHGDCAACHSTPAVNKMGFELYQAACTICHEAEHRAASVPDLKILGKNRDADYWRKWITSSEQGKLMPAFAIEQGGILSSVQIESLVKYLTELNKPVKPAESPSPPSHQP